MNSTDPAKAVADLNRVIASGGNLGEIAKAVDAVRRALARSDLISNRSRSAAAKIGGWIRGH